MANEIDLFKDLEYCDKAIKATKGDKSSQKAWQKEKRKVVKEIKTNYPELALGKINGKIYTRKTFYDN